MCVKSKLKKKGVEPTQNLTAFLPTSRFEQRSVKAFIAEQSKSCLFSCETVAFWSCHVSLAETFFVTKRA